MALLNGTRVRKTRGRRTDMEGVVVARLPYTFAGIAYDVDYGTLASGPYGYPFVAESERDLEVMATDHLENGENDTLPVALECPNLPAGDTVDEINEKR